MVSARQQFFFEFFYVVYFGDGNDGEFSQMATDDDGLCIGIADDTDSRITREFGKFGFEFRAEVGVFYIVDRPFENAIFIRHDTGTFRT